MTYANDAAGGDYAATANRQHKSDSAQPGLFPGSQNRDHLVREAIARTIKLCPIKRQEIAERLSVALGVNVTVSMLDAYTATSKTDHRFPLAWVEAFCRVTNDWNLLFTVIASCGFAIKSEGDDELIELGRHFVARKVSDAAIANLLYRVTNRGDL